MLAAWLPPRRRRRLVISGSEDILRKRYTIMRYIRWIQVTLTIMALLALGSCASTRPLETEITGQSVRCDDGDHQVLNCHSIFAQYKRDFEAGVKLLDAIGTKYSLQTNSLIQLDQLTGDLMLHRQSLCRNYNNCLITKAEYVEEERKLSQLQIELRQAVALGGQGVSLESETFSTSDSFGTESSGIDIGIGDTLEAGSLEDRLSQREGGSEEFATKSVTGKLFEVLNIVKKDIIQARGLQMQDTSTAPSGPRVSSTTPTAAAPAQSVASGGVEEQVDSLVVELTRQLQQNAPNKLGSRVVVGPINSQDYQYETPFGRYVASLVETRMQKTDAVQMVQPKRMRGIGILDDPKEPGTLAKRSDADLVLHGSQVATASGVQIQLALSEGAEAQPLAAANANFSANQIPVDHPAQANNIEAISENQAVLSQMGEKASGRLHLDLWTDRGGSSATYYEGDEIRVILRANLDCYLRLFYLDASGNTIQLFPNSRESADQLQANQEMEIPSAGAGYRFAVQPPFGTEQLVAIASIVPIPETEGMDVGNGQKILPNAAAAIVDTMEQVESRTRGVQDDPDIAWQTILLTTLPRTSS